MTDYTIRLFAADQYENYVRAVHRGDSSGGTTDTQLRRRWWCFDNPNAGAFAAVFANDEVAATCYLSGKLLNIGGELHKVFEIGETATAPDHQRRGLFGKLVNACIEYAFDNGATAIYGTPNSQSTPGYAKLKFDIIESEHSHLFFSPNLRHFAMPSMPPTSEMYSHRTHLGKAVKMASSEFYAHAKSRSRLNDFSPGYFQWRFCASPHKKYEFYRLGDFSMAVCRAKLGKYDVLLVSDYGQEGSNGDAIDSVKLIRSIHSEIYQARDHAGIYFHAPLNDRMGRLRCGMNKLIHHRILPVCVMHKGNRSLLDSLHAAPLPQLSDCDIG